MNVFELMLWAVEAFATFANGVVYFLFNQPLTFTITLPGAPFTFITVPNIATLIINPITMAGIWSWQIIKTVVL